MLPFHEKLLHFIWHSKNFSIANLHTTGGESITVEYSGLPNNNAGPDFEMAKVRIGDTLLIGAVEIHWLASDWRKHKHDHDARYKNVVLHVVWENDSAEMLHIPVLELKNVVSNELLSRYQRLMEASHSIACHSMIHDVPPFTLVHQIEKSAVERLTEKSILIAEILQAQVNDWEQTAWIWMAKCWGAPVNSEPFAATAELLPAKLFLKQADTLQIAALIFGCAGFLDGHFDDPYPTALKKEFLYLKRLHNLSSLVRHRFRFSQMRPQSFPTVRLAQLAAFVTAQPRFFNQLLEVETVTAFAKMIRQPIAEYWQQHFDFDKPSSKAVAETGEASIQTLGINAAAPLLFAYGKYKGDEGYCERAVDWLNELKTEKNRITRLWAAEKVQAGNAFQSQGLIQLFNHYCSRKRCLECGIGRTIFADKA